LLKIEKKSKKGVSKKVLIEFKDRMRGISNMLEESRKYIIDDSFGKGLVDLNKDFYRFRKDALIGKGFEILNKRLVDTLNILNNVEIDFGKGFENLNKRLVDTLNILNNVGIGFGKGFENLNKRLVDLDFYKILKLKNIKNYIDRYNLSK